MARGNVVRLANFTPIADDLSAATDAFLAVCKSRNLSGCTINYYSYRLTAFRRFLEASELPAAPAAVTPKVIRDFLTAEADNNSPTTASHSHCTLSAFFKFLVVEGYMESNPMQNVDKPKRRKQVINTFSMEQVDAVLQTCGKDFPGVRDRAIILLLTDSGLRASELAGLELQDVDWTGQTVLVLGKGDKERLVPFGQATRQALAQYVARRGDLETNAVFVSTLGQQLNRYRVRDVIIGRCDKAGITGVRCSPHTFRHTMAVSYLRNGGGCFDLQKILGHSDLTMTRKYAELSQTDVQDKHRLYSPADRLKAAKTTSGRTRIR